MGLAFLLLLLQDSTGKAKSAALHVEGFDLPESEFEFTLKAGPGEKKFKSYEVKFPSAVKTDLEANNTVPGTIWVPVSDKPVPGLVIVHFIGGNHDILATVGEALARDGIASIFFKLPYYGSRNGGQGLKGLARAATSKDLKEFLRQSILDVRRARDVLAATPGVDASRVGVLGVSLGALIGAAAAGIDPTFSHVVLIDGGADLAKIIFHRSRETQFIADKLAQENMDEAKARELFAPVDPLTYASHLPADRCVLFNMKQDEVIPKDCTEALVEKIGGKPRQFWYDGKHTWVGLYVVGIVYETKKFILGE
jgi:dienelactone hydrolase